MASSIHMTVLKELLTITGDITLACSNNANPCFLALPFISCGRCHSGGGGLQSITSGSNMRPHHVSFIFLLFAELILSELIPVLI